MDRDGHSIGVCAGGVFAGLEVYMGVDAVVCDSSPKVEVSNDGTFCGSEDDGARGWKAKLTATHDNSVANVDCGIGITGVLLAGCQCEWTPALVHISSVIGTPASWRGTLPSTNVSRELPL